jgi:hypothetical protein
MAEEVTNIVKNSSDGFVKISVERYHELLEQAAVKPATIVRTTINKTPAMVAQENKAWGGTMIGIGAAFVLVGAIRFKIGVSQTKALMDGSK